MQLVTIEAIAILLYGLLSPGGGVLGYVKSGSKVSLISGSISGALLIVLAVLAFFGNPWAYLMAALVIGLLVITFIVRFFKTRKFMPAIPMVALGVAAIVVILFGTTL